MNALQLAYDFEVLTCGECGIVFAVGAAWIDFRRKDHNTWHCPNGHSRYFPEKSEEEKLRQQLEQKQRSLDYERSAKERAQRQVIAARGQVTKIKNRVSAGVCPCCHRTSQNLSRHMAGQHPDWKNQEVG